MTSILNADPYPWGDADAVRLHKALTETFFEVADAENIAAAATLNTRKLYTRQGPDPFWRDVLNAAAANGLTHKLAEVATSRLPATAPLHALLARLLAEAPPVDTATRLHRVRSDVRLRLNGILDHNRVVGGRTRELATLDAFLADPTPQHLVLTGQAGMGKTALLVEWVRRLDARSDVDEICYFISRQHGTAKYSDLLRTLLIQAVAVREGEPPLPGSADDELERAWLQELQPSWSGLRPRPIVVVIDGVDEAEARGWSVPQLLLPTRLAADVHMVVSARTMGDRDWPYELGLTGAKLLPVGGLDEADVADLLAVAGVPAWVREPDALSTLMERTDGDPFYLRFLVDALTGRARKKITSPTALRNVPDGLTSYLKELWDDAGGSAGNTARLTTLGYLCEAKGPITMKELAEIDPDDGLKVHVIRGVLDQIGDRVVVVDPTSEGITLAHWRLQEIVAADLMSDRDRVACRDALLAWCRRWAQHRHPYAVKYVAAHRIESATGPDDLAAATDLLADAEYQKLRVEELDDAAGLFGDLDRLLRAVTDDATSPAATLVRAALAVGDARTDWSRPERVFELVDEGKADDAVRRLALLGSPAWQPWQQGGSLVLAWALAEAHPDTARDLLNAAARLPGGHPLQDLLAGRVRHALRDGPEPELRLWFPPFALPPSDRGQAVAALERASGQPVNPYNLSGLRDPRSYTSSNESGAYLAEDEAPWLVAYARDEPGEGEAWLKSYLALQAGNPYALYRNWALWSVLAAVCCLPDPAQALPYAVLVTQAAFAPSAVRFSEFAHLAAVAGTGDTATVTAARSAAMRDAAAVAGLGELGDQWGTTCAGSPPTRRSRRSSSATAPPQRRCSATRWRFRSVTRASARPPSSRWPRSSRSSATRRVGARRWTRRCARRTTSRSPRSAR